MVGVSVARDVNAAVAKSTATLRQVIGLNVAVKVFCYRGTVAKAGLPAHPTCTGRHPSETNRVVSVANYLAKSS